MLRYLLLSLACTALSAHAQIGRKELRTDSGTVVLHYFKGGGISTKEWMDADDRWGRSWAYAKDGRVLVDQQTRRFAGHAGVHFSYHPNGTISKAEASDAPDGGIQWYRSTTTFDENGVRTGFWEQGHDDDGIIPRIDVHTVPAPTETPQPPAQVAECQKLFVNEAFLVNPTSSACRVRSIPKAPSPALQPLEQLLAPGDTLRLGTYTVGERFDEPGSHIVLHLEEQSSGAEQSMPRLRTAHVQVTPEHRRYYTVIDGWFAVRPAPGQEHLPGLGIPKEKKKRRWLFFR